jgi:hypothetical protein
MSKVLWHTMIIKVPVEMVDFTPKGKVSVKKTLTKMGSIAKSQKKPSIQIMPSKDGEVHVIEGKKVSELKDTMKKVKELEKKNKGRDIFAKETESFSTKVKKYARNLVLDKKNLPQLPSLSEGAKWENKKLYEDLKKAHKLMDDTPLGWKASIDGLADAKEKLSQSSSLDNEILQHNVKYFENLVRKNKSLLTKDFGTQFKVSKEYIQIPEPKEPEPKKSKEQNMEDVRIPEPKTEPKTKISLKDFEYLKKDDIDFIVKNKIDEEGAREIDSLKSMISYYIESLQIKEHVIDAVQELMKRGKRDSQSLSEWKNFMKDLIIKDITKSKLPTKQELIRKNYPDLTPDDIQFILENDLHHDDITKMDKIRFRFKQDKKEPVPRFSNKAERSEYLEDLKKSKEKKLRQ